MNDGVMNTIDQLYSKYYRELYHYSFSLFDYKQQHLQDAEDCVQEAFEKAVRRPQQLASHPEPFLYLKKTCYHIAITKRRNMKNRSRILGYPVPLGEEQEVPQTQDLITDWIIRQENREAKACLLDQLTDGENRVYHAYFERNLSIRETAESLGISHGAARGCIQRIRAKAREMKHFWFFCLIACIFLC